MKRVSRVAALGAVALLALSGIGRAQQAVYVGVAPGDSAVGLIPGAEFIVPVRAVNPSGTYNWINHMRLTFHYDPSAVEIVGVLPDGLNSFQDSSTTSGAFTVSASGCASGTDAGLVRLRVKLKPGAPSGAYVWATADSSQFWYYCYSYYGSPVATAFAGTITQYCAATSMYGDVDASGRIDSRDALITLSAAVGLPVGGFNMALGDVDLDGLTNSRDALMLLSYSIGLSSGSNRLGSGIPSACPGLTPPGESMVFRRFTGVGSDVDLLYLAANSITPTLVNSYTSPGYLGPPRLAAHDSTIAYHCQDPFAGPDQVCLIQKSGANARGLTTTGSETVEFSPDGSQVLFGRTSELRVIPTIGGAEAVLTAGGVASGSQSWNKNGTTIAYLVRCFAGNPCQNVGTIDPDSSTAALVSIAGLSTDGYREVRWSPAGDSLAVTRFPFAPWNEPGVFVVGALGGTARVAARLPNMQPANPYGFFSGLIDWGPGGIAVTVQAPGLHGIWMVDGAGAAHRITAGDDDSPSFRRTP